MQANADAFSQECQKQLGLKVSCAQQATLDQLVDWQDRTARAEAHLDEIAKEHEQATSEQAARYCHVRVFPGVPNNRSVILNSITNHSWSTIAIPIHMEKSRAKWLPIGNNFTVLVAITWPDFNPEKSKGEPTRGSPFTIQPQGGHVIRSMLFVNDSAP